MSGSPSIVKLVRSFVGRVAREAALYPRIVSAKRRGGPRVAFLPSDAKVQSSLLRAWNIAAGLEADHGWSTLVVPVHLKQNQRERVLALFRPDIVVVQQCRHPLNRVDYLSEYALVLDIDDADFLDTNLTNVLQRMAGATKGVICGSRYIQNWALEYNPHSIVIWTGTPVSPGPWPDHSERQPIVAWAQSSALGYREEFEFVCNVMKAVTALRGPTGLRLYGWDADVDHPSLQRLREAGVQVETVPFIPYAEFLVSLRGVAVGLSPIWPQGFSLGKSFGKILGYLDAKVPVICSDAADHELFFTASSGVVSNDMQVWVDAICDLLDNPAKRSEMSDTAHRAFVDKLSTGQAVRSTHEFLASLVQNAQRVM